MKIANYQNTDKFWFEEGWKTFAEQNKLAYNDHMLFKFDGESTFDFELFDEHDDKKEYVRIPNSVEEKGKEQLDGMEPEQVFPESESMVGERGNVHSEPVESESQLQLEPRSEERQDPQGPEEQQEMQLYSGVEPQLEPETEDRQDMQLDQGQRDGEDNTRPRRTVRQRRGKINCKKISFFEFEPGNTMVIGQNIKSNKYLLNSSSNNMN